LYPNDVQAAYFSQACGVARFAWNWALAEWKRHCEEGRSVSEAELRKKLNAVKREEFPWMLDVTKCAPQLSIKDLGVAFKNFFEGRAGFPQFKKKGQRESFRISNDQFVIEGEKMRVPSLGWVRLAESLRFEGKVMGATINRTAGEWYAAVQVKMTDPAPIHDPSDSSEASVEITLDGEKLAILSDGTQTDIPKEHDALLSRARRLKRSLTRKVGGTAGEAPSHNFRRAKKKLARLQNRLSNVRNDALHRLTTQVTRRYGVIEIEASPASPSDALTPGTLSPPLPEAEGGRRRWKSDPLRATSQASAYEFRRQLEYKARITGSRVKVKE
jgi:putative transposase